MRSWAMGCLRRLRAVLLLLLAAPLVVLAATHLLVGDRSMVVAAIHAGIGWWLAPAAPLAALCVVLGHRRVAFLLLVVAFLHLARVAPGHCPAPASGPPDLAVGTANLLMVNPTPDALVDELLRLDADVWSLQEVDPAWAARLDDPRVRARYPHRLVHPLEGSFGVAVLSREPFEGAWVEDLGGVPVAVARVSGVTVVAVHTLPPRTPELTREWHHQLALLAERVVALPAPVVVAGDLNATRHHPSWRRLVARARLRDAYAMVGRVSTWSWPAPPYGLFVPPLRLDHLLVSEGLQAVATAEGDAAGSDHRPLVAFLTRTL